MLLNSEIQVAWATPGVDGFHLRDYAPHIDAGANHVSIADNSS
jgi:hypothetical protein